MRFDALTFDIKSPSVIFSQSYILYKMCYIIKHLENKYG